MVDKDKETSGQQDKEVRNANEERKEAQTTPSPGDTQDSLLKKEDQPGYDPSEVETPPAGTTDMPDDEDAQVAAAADKPHAGNQPVSPAVDHTLSEDNVKDIDEPAPVTDKSVAEEEQHEEEGEEDEEEEQIDYSHLSKEELVKRAEELLLAGDWRKADRRLEEIKHFFDDIYNAERQQALEKFTAEGGDEADFQYREYELDQRFHAAYRKVKEEKSKHYSSQQRSREENLRRKNEVLARLREFTDAEETNTSLKELKKLQEEWKSIGPVPQQYNNNLWANYNALLDRFYNNRSILYELKELDRRKNLEAKTEIVERAEKLSSHENMKEAIRELRELHEEFKHIGPVPREEQEPLWQRFKEASDKVYDKRREHLEQLNKDLEANLLKKRDLGDKVQEFLDFSSDRITEWNDKTKELLNLQKEWDAVGGLPRQVAKEVNKYFWSAFKGFFSNKNQFFKDLEKMREQNLQLKEELVAEAQKLQESQDWQQTANRFKELQRRWKEIGPVPEKQRDEVYKRFKAAADTFFENKRAQGKELNQEFEENLKRKMEVIDKINALAEKKTADLDAFTDLQEEYESIGFVSRNDISKVKTAYSEATEKFLASAENLSAEEKERLRLQTQISRIKSAPDSGRKLQQKENNIRRQISKVENDISIWKNNLEFFASSRNADKLKNEFSSKIEEAEAELGKLKDQLRIVQENE
ncbi:DUF349 domain-containing protein [Nafulsella turpanensis]|uniref:DUF349 domain-containing protein n=1 Tax=Nafulsella turpanensis TaxID=1265690 RepID=UPI00034809C0|nr:DUF349 domain-containing protein [Nafulsella turpanensis]